MHFQFYWPTALQDVVKLVKTCKACQFHAKKIHTPAQMLQMIPPSWPFAVWGLDIMGPFLGTVGGLVPLCHHRQVHQVAESNPSGQNQQAIRCEIHQVHHMQI
jgi:hypothetical protein